MVLNRPKCGCCAISIIGWPGCGAGRVLAILRLTGAFLTEAGSAGVNWASLSTGSVTTELFDTATFWDIKLLRGANRHAMQLCFSVDSVERQSR